MAHAKKDGWAEVGTYGDHLYEIEVAGAPALVESQRMPVNTVLLTAQELARGVFQSNPVAHATWKKWRFSIIHGGSKEEVRVNIISKKATGESSRTPYRTRS